jgi:hypothetical protein
MDRAFLSYILYNSLQKKILLRHHLSRLRIKGGVAKKSGAMILGMV